MVQIILTETPSISDLKAAFKYKKLDQIKGAPLFADVMSMRKKCAANAQSKAIRNGPVGFAGLVLHPTSYVNLTGRTWNRYPDPGDTPIYPPGNPSTSEIATIKDNWKIQRLNYETMIQMDAALTSLIIEAVPEIYLRGVIYGSLGVTNRTTYEIFEHLLRNAPATVHDKNMNHARMTKTYNPDEHIQVLFSQIDDAQEIGIAANAPYSNEQLVQAGETAIVNTGQYIIPYTEWIAKRATDKTWLNFKTHFLEAYMTRKTVTTTSSQAGFSSANNITSEGEINHTSEGENTDELARAVAALAAAQADQNEAVSQYSVDAQLNEQLEQKNIEIQTLQNQLQAMAVTARNSNPQQQQWQRQQQNNNNSPQFQPYQQQNFSSPPNNQNHQPFSQTPTTYRGGGRGRSGRGRGRGRWQGHSPYNTSPAQNFVTHNPNYQNTQQGYTGRNRQNPPFSNTRKYFNNLNYCWSCGHDVEDWHHSGTCPRPKSFHNPLATKQNTMGGSMKNAHKTWQGAYF